MNIPQDLDLTRPDDELVEQLLAIGGYTREEAEDTVALLKDPDGPMLE